MRKVMEPKVIKEETTDKETANHQENSSNGRTRSSSKVSSKDRCKTPDSPEGARLAQTPLSPTQSSPTPHPANGGASPANNGSADSLTPPLPPSAALTLETAQVHPYTHGNYTTCVTRPLVKVKRFLSTLVQFGSDIGTDVGDRVRSLVLSLVSSNLSIEEFHQSLQDVTNFPLRPFVLPFLRTHLPLLQREVHALARANKQSTLQYIRSHDYVILDPAHSPTELSEIFLPNDSQAGIKRRASDSIYENGVNGQTHFDSQDYLSAKRPLISQNPFTSHQNLLISNVGSTLPSSHFFDYSQHSHTYQHRLEDSEGSKPIQRSEEEWRNIHVMLNCILSMVEKTKRALTILQQRNSQELATDWLRRQDVSVDLKKAANEIMMHAVKQTEDKVAEVRRRAEDAVNDVKRQAVVELQKAVAAAEMKANELVASERAKMEKLLIDARKQSEDQNQNNETADNSLSPPTSSQSTQPPQNSCWNCGRKAHETCSGCSLARYCGPFCQHKDWENHHQACSKDKLRSATPTVGILQTETVKFKK